MATIKGTLKHGLKVGEAVHKEYEIREGTTADLFDAEDEAPVHKRLSYKGALLGRLLVRLGDLSGPIDMVMIRKLHRADFDQLCSDLDKVDQEGKSEPGS